MRSIQRLLPIAALALLAACGGNEPSPGVAANTTEVIAAENVTTSDAMVTNIDAAAPTGGDAQDQGDAEDAAPVADNGAENAL